MNKLSGHKDINYQLIIFSPGNITKNEIIKTKKNISLIDSPIAGLLSLNQFHMNQSKDFYKSFLNK